MVQVVHSAAALLDSEVVGAIALWHGPHDQHLPRLLPRFSPRLASPSLTTDEVHRNQIARLELRRYEARSANSAAPPSVRIPSASPAGRMRSFLLPCS